MAGESLAQGWRAVSRGFRGVYDYVGMTMVVSSIWFFLGFTPAALTFMVFLQVPRVASFLIFGICWVALLGPATAMAYSVIMDLLDGEDVRVGQVFSHLTRHYKKAVRLSLVMGVILGILVVDVLFFTQVTTGWSRYVAVLWGYFIVFWALMAQYVFPFAVRRDATVLEILKMSALMALDNVVATFVTGFFSLVVIVASVFLRVPIMLFMMGAFAFLHGSTFNELIAKYRRTGEGADKAGEESVSNDD